MKFLPLLKSQISKRIVLEFSDKLIQKLVKKFQEETKDDTDTILSYISDFEKFKDTLPADARNIEKYSYKDLVDVVSPKRLKNDINKYLKFFKKTTKGVPSQDIIKTIRKFLELQKFMSDKDKDITKYNYLDLVGFLEKNFEKAMSKILKEKLKNETQLNNEQILYYINTYFNILNTIPVESKLVTDMKGDEFEHFIDGLAETTDIPEGSNDLGSIELVYDKNNLKVFAPKTKDQCILLRNGRSWCTSRDGSSNLYYNYRLNNNLTLYYVINEDLPYSDTNFASVILVQTDGRKRLADGTNSGRYSGHDAIPWDDIVKKIPKLSGLESIFVPKPLTEEEKQTIDKVKNTRVGDNPTKSFDGDQSLVELWLEITSPRLNDEQYINISDDLQKKYISLGFSLSPKQIENSSAKVMEYYVSRKLESLKTKGLNQLDESDLALLNTPILKKLKESLKTSFVDKLSIPNNRLEIDDMTKSDVGKFISLYGFDELFDLLPESLVSIKLRNKGETSINFDIPASISRFKNLYVLFLENCVKSIPDSICELRCLQMFGFPNNPNLKSLPECMSNMCCLVMINASNMSEVIPSSLRQRMGDMGNGIYDVKADKEKCPQGCECKKTR